MLVLALFSYSLRRGAQSTSVDLKSFVFCVLPTRFSKGTASLDHYINTIKKKKTITKYQHPIINVWSILSSQYRCSQSLHHSDQLGTGALVFPGLVRTPALLFVQVMCFHVTSSVFVFQLDYLPLRSSLYRCLLVEVEDLTLLVSCFSNIALLILSMQMVQY